MSESILLIDDDPFLVSSLSRLLTTSGFAVTSAQTIEDGWNQIQTREPALAILDLSLPDGDGNDLCRRIRTKWEFPILMLTSRAESIDKVTGLGLGADDYLTKPFDPHELVARIRALLRRAGKNGGPGNEIKVGDLSVNLHSREVVVNGQAIQLTQTEFEVISYMAQNRDRVMHRDQIFQAVWGYDSEFASNSLDVLIYRIRTKLKAAGGREYIGTVRGYGFRLKGNDE